MKVKVPFEVSKMKK